MGAAQIVTREDVEAALLRVEQGTSDKDDANLIRAYLQRLEWMYSMERDEEYADAP